MNKRKIAVGPGASSLILIAVVLSLCVLTVLTMISARNDEALALRSTETRQEVYALFASGEKSLAKLDAVLVSCLKDQGENADAYLEAVKNQLPEGMKMREDRVSWTEKSADRALECAVRINEPGAPERMTWVLHRLDAGEIWEDDGWGEDFEEEDESEDFEPEEETAEAESAEEAEADAGADEAEPKTEGEEIAE